MFTGLVQALGTVRSVRDMASAGNAFEIAFRSDAEPLSLGESIAVNGACLTVVGFDAESFTVQAGPETLQKTNLGSLIAGDRVNLERALRVGDRLGGHFVTGHVDGVGTIVERVRNGDWETLAFEYPPAFGDMIVAKGSIAVDGVSLTVVEVQPQRFTVMLIPHTAEHTTLGHKPVGAAVNLETDLIAKHVQKLFQNMSITI